MPTLDASVVTADNNGSEELVLILGATLLIAGLDGGDRILARLTLTKTHSLEGNLNTLPTLIAVHCVVAANNSGNLTNANLFEVVDKLLHIASTRLRVGIAAIAEEMDEDLFYTILLGGSQKSVQVSLLRVLCIELESACMVQFDHFCQLTTPP